ncbi:MAG: sensor histidine kinase [Pseudomonadota bacterium]
MSRAAAIMRGADFFGLDARPRPASTRERILMGLRRSAPFSSLQRRIIFFNLLGLAVLVFGVLYLNQFRTGLIEQRVRSLAIEGQIIAFTIAESAGDYGEDIPASALERPELDRELASVILNRLAQPTRTRARLYDTELNLVSDTRQDASGSGPVVVSELPPPGSDQQLDIIEWLEDFYDGLILPTETSGGDRLYSEVAEAAELTPSEVREAALGRVANSVSVNSQQNLIVTVAIPVRRFKTVIGVLLLSTEGDDINDVVERERIGILQIFVIAAMVSVGLSVLLANTIASPIRRLARAVDPAGTSTARPLNPERVEVPDMTRRTDEIGDLSAAIIRMTEALYRRIEAIESFAADVSHEIKNPLTSMRSAIETMSYAKTPEQRQKLLDVIMSDVMRLDRLVTDISNASRLDAELVRERMETFDLGALLDRLVTVTETQGEKVGVDVKLDVPSEGLVARGLEGRLAQVFANLLDNALSFSPEGSTIRVVGEALEGGVRVTVTDGGPGIPPDNLRTVFERFYSERPEHSFGNHSGLGLSICRQIVEAHSGRIWAENLWPQETEAAQETNDWAAEEQSRHAHSAPVDDMGDDMLHDGPEGPAPLGARFTVELPE